MQDKDPAPSTAELKTCGLKATLPRRKVLEIFQHSRQRHLSAEQVYKLLLDAGADVGLATVYRVMMQFAQAGLLLRSHFETGKAVFELNQGQHHDHMVCLRCGRVERFFDAQIEQRQRTRGRGAGLRVAGARTGPVWLVLPRGLQVTQVALDKETKHARPTHRHRRTERAAGQ